MRTLFGKFTGWARHLRAHRQVAVTLAKIPD